MVPTFQELICKVQISTFFRKINSLHRIHVNKEPNSIHPTKENQGESGVAGPRFQLQSINCMKKT
ncbi:hypothetical protein [Leptospira kirschneri]|uniref:hypothetical protein n=1 Tax=Leptospira kirschneri TaxID=29507 RepID=UPI00277B5CB9|nr:hypothetical protein [Leptospira kirschneri]